MITIWGRRNSHNVKKVGWAELARVPFLSGDRFCLSDIPMRIFARTFFALPFTRPALANLEDWYAGLTERPCYRSQVMSPLT